MNTGCNSSPGWTIRRIIGSNRRTDNWLGALNLWCVELLFVSQLKFSVDVSLDTIFHYLHESKWLAVSVFLSSINIVNLCRSVCRLSCDLRGVLANWTTEVMWKPTWSQRAALESVALGGFAIMLQNHKASSPRATKACILRWWLSNMDSWMQRR